MKMKRPQEWIEKRQEWTKMRIKKMKSKKANEEVEAQEAENNEDEDDTITRASGSMSLRKQSRKTYDSKSL